MGILRQRSAQAGNQEQFKQVVPLITPAPAKLPHTHVWPKHTTHPTDAEFRLPRQLSW